MLDSLLFFLGPVILFFGILAAYFALAYWCNLMTKERSWINFWLAVMLLIAVTIYRVVFVYSPSGVVHSLTALVLIVAYFACAYQFNLMTKERAWKNFWLFIIAIIFLVLLRVVEVAYLDIVTHFVPLPAHQ